MMNFSLTEAEFDALAGKYKTEAPENLFNYFGFCHTINSAFTQKGIDKDPEASVKPITKDDTVAARRKYLEVAPEEEEQMNNILSEYKVAVQNRRINLKP
jgi:hypothetical protein